MTTRRHLLQLGLGGLAALAAPPLLAQDSQDPLLDPLTGEALPPYDPSAPQMVLVVEDLPPGQIHVEPNLYALYLTLGDGLALRYGIGVGRPGLYESGVFYVGAKKEWPEWTPTPDMIEREPDRYAQYADGMPGGPNNPLGARALYLFTEDRGDTFLRIHGTNAPDTIGTAVSNGCARLTNDGIIDLYGRVAEGTPVILYPQGPVIPAA